MARGPAPSRRVPRRDGAAGEDRLQRCRRSAASRGKVRTRIFQGNHWLYQVDTAAGLVMVIRQNAGEPGPAEGEAVRLAWRAEDMVLRAGERTP